MAKSIPFNDMTLLKVITDNIGNHDQYDEDWCNRFKQDPKTYSFLIQWLESMQGVMYETLGIMPSQQFKLRDELKAEIAGEQSKHVSIHMMLSKLVFSVVEAVERGPLDPLETASDLVKDGLDKLRKLQEDNDNEFDLGIPDNFDPED